MSSIQINADLPSHLDSDPIYHQSSMSTIIEDSDDDSLIMVNTKQESPLQQPEDNERLQKRGRDFQGSTDERPTQRRCRSSSSSVPMRAWVTKESAALFISAFHCLGSTPPPHSKGTSRLGVHTQSQAIRSLVEQLADPDQDPSIILSPYQDFEHYDDLLQIPLGHISTIVAVLLTRPRFIALEPLRDVIHFNLGYFDVDVDNSNLFILFDCTLSRFEEHDQPFVLFIFSWLFPQWTAAFLAVLYERDDSAGSKLRILFAMGRAYHLIRQSRNKQWGRAALRSFKFALGNQMYHQFAQELRSPRRLE